MDLRSEVWDPRWSLDPKWELDPRSGILRWNLDMKSGIQNGVGFRILES